MMAKGKKKARGRTAVPGRTVNPARMLDEASPAPPSPVKPVPIGRPVKDTQYKELKERAKKQRPPSSQKPQTDPGD
jgi:hypothetical protein